MTQLMPFHLQIQQFNGPNNPQMPQNMLLKAVLPLNVLIYADIARQRADKADTAFQQDASSHRNVQSSVVTMLQTAINKVKPTNPG